MKKIQLWSVAESDEGQLQAVGLDEVENTETEERLEELLVASPSMLVDGLTLIARQLPTQGGPLDLLGVDQDGRLVLFELKRGTLTREAVAQILDYASDLVRCEQDQLARLIEEHSDKGGIDQFDDFADWYAREFPNAQDFLAEVPRMVLVGLGVDERAKRIVNFLANSGIDIQLLTFHAFDSAGRLLLARQVETSPPTQQVGSSSGLSKGESRELLMKLADEQGVKDLLGEVADFIDVRMPCYRWPGKTAYSFSLQERTKQGRPTLRVYVTLWVDRKKRGKLFVTLPPRSAEAAPEAVSKFIEQIPTARKVDSSWGPVQFDIDAKSWPSMQTALGGLLDDLVSQWKLRTSEAESEDQEPHTVESQ